MHYDSQFTSHLQTLRPCQAVIGLASPDKRAHIEPGQATGHLYNRCQFALPGGFSSRLVCSAAMAKSRYEYVKDFETDDRMLQGCWIVIRLDGKAFTKYALL